MIKSTKVKYIALVTALLLTGCNDSSTKKVAEPLQSLQSFASMRL